jgi:hypothetical protein
MMRKAISIIISIVLIGSMFSFADFDDTLTSREEGFRNSQIEVMQESKYISNFVYFYEGYSSAPSYYSYNSGGFSGSLSLYGSTKTDDGVVAFYRGTVYKGTYVPFSIIIKVTK